jgi:hypothetical protein
MKVVAAALIVAYVGGQASNSVSLQVRIGIPDLAQ